MHPRIIPSYLAALTLVITAAARAQTAPALVPAQELRPRAGLPNTAARIAANQEIRVAYVGGSITNANGWRPQTTAWLKKQYPNATFSEIHAAVSGTGSIFGAYRFDTHVLQYKPDLIFIEFAVNDSATQPQDIIRGMEGMVRKAWSANPSSDICFVYTFMKNQLPDLSAGRFPRSASTMESVADHYNIPSIHMGLQAVQNITDGTWLMQAPKPPAGQDPTKSDGKTIFSNDGVHPLDNTGATLYAQAVARSLQTMLAASATAQPHAMPAPLAANNYQQAKLIDIDSTMTLGRWTQLPADHADTKFARKLLPQLWYTNTPGAELVIKFKGTSIGLFQVNGPDSGIVSITLDDKPARNLTIFNQYCDHFRMNNFEIARDLPDTVHTLTIRLLDESPDKAKILGDASKLTPPEKFKDNALYLGQLMLVGDIMK